MADGATLLAAPDRLLQLAGRLEAADGFAEVVASLRGGHGATFDGVWGSSCALLAAALARHAPGPLVVVCPHPHDIDELVEDLALFAAETSERFPAWESSPDEGLIHDEVFGDRVRLLKLLAGTEEMGTGASPQSRSPLQRTLGSEPVPISSLSPLTPRLIVTSIQSLLQPVPRADRLLKQTRTLRIGDAVDLESLLTWLVEHGFHATSAVELPGEFSPRGGILDIFAPDWYDPVRIELFGDEIESIRRFEVATPAQPGSRSTRSTSRCSAPAPTTASTSPATCRRSSWFLLVEPANWRKKAGTIWSGSTGRRICTASARTLRRGLRGFPRSPRPAWPAGSLETTCHLQIESVERFSGDIAKVRDELDAAGAGQDVFVVCQTEAEVEAAATKSSARRSWPPPAGCTFPIGRLQAGFRLVGRADRAGQRQRAVSPRRSAPALAPPAGPRDRQLSRAARRRLRRPPVARHRPLSRPAAAGESTRRPKSTWSSSSTAARKIFVPGLEDRPGAEIRRRHQEPAHAGARSAAARGSGRRRPPQQAVTDLAADMLELQAAAGHAPGHRLSRRHATGSGSSTPRFPTTKRPTSSRRSPPSSATCTQPRPMDRLLCGDVGFGKTEVAMRAAFKAVDTGYQVAVLVPTTILAEQHRRTFRARMAEFPFQIAALSRFCTAQGAAAAFWPAWPTGSIDIVIGTHRLAQPDVQFHNLGLVVIDEEQRFGVEVKERLKALRHTVDVLTMTATPIPRTLHMSLLGLRDISNLETPPDDRLAVETRVTRFDAELIRHAVHARAESRRADLLRPQPRQRHRDCRPAAAADRARGPHRASATARCPRTSWSR